MVISRKSTKILWIGLVASLSLLAGNHMLNELEGLAKAQTSAPPIGAKSNFFPDYNTGSSANDYGIVQLVGARDGNASKKMKGRTTIVDIFVPESTTGSITVKIIGGCDTSDRDTPVAGSYTEFFVREMTASVSSQSAGCSYANPDLSLTFSQDASRSRKIQTSPTESYNKYTLQANAVGAEWIRYLNAFQVRVDKPGVYVGASAEPVPCGFNAYPLSCPNIFYENTLTPLPMPHGEDVNSYSYSSFYLSNAGSGVEYEFSTKCENTKAQLLIYDLDGEDGSLGQNFTLEFTANGTNVITFDHNTILLLGGKNNQTLALPTPGDFVDMGRIKDFEVAGATADGMLDVKPGVIYKIKLTGLSDDNAFQVLPHVEQGDCVSNTPPEGDIVVVCDPNTWQVTLKRARVKDAEGGKLTVTARKVVKDGVEAYDFGNKIGSKIVDKDTLTPVEFTDPNNTFTVPQAYRDSITRRVQASVEDSKGSKSTIYGSFKCENTKPTGEIIATCDKATGIVTIRAKVKDAEGGLLKVTAYRVMYGDGSPDQWLGSKAEPDHKGQKDAEPDESTPIDYLPLTFSGKKDDKSHYVIGEVTDSGGATSPIQSNKYSCSNAPPSGSIVAECDDGTVTLYALVRDNEGGEIKVTADTVVFNGVSSTIGKKGMKVIPPSPDTNRSINYTDPNDSFTSAEDGLTKTVVGTVKDSTGQASTIIGTFSCPPPAESDAKCPRVLPDFFPPPKGFWKSTNGVDRIKPENIGKNTDIDATIDYIEYKYKDNNLRNINVKSMLTNTVLDTRPAGVEVNLWLLEANYKPLVDAYPYDTHDVKGTAKYTYVENKYKMKSMTITWKEWQKVADGYYGYYAKGSPAPAGGTFVGGNKDWDVYYFTIPQYGYVYLADTYPPGGPYTAPAATNEFGGWSVHSASPQYDLVDKIEHTDGEAKLNFPTMEDCLWRKVSISLDTKTPSWDNIENPKSANFSTKLTSKFNRDINDGPKTGNVYTPTQINANQTNPLPSPVFQSTYQVMAGPSKGFATRNFTATQRISGKFTPPEVRPTIPLNGGHNSITGIVEETSSDSFRVYRKDTPVVPNAMEVDNSDQLCNLISAQPISMYVDSTGKVREIIKNGPAEASNDCIRSCPAGDPTCLVDRPYYKVFNADALATGMQFASGQVCNGSNGQGRLRGFVSPTDARIGTSSQVSALAAIGIEGPYTSARGFSSSVPSAGLTARNRLTYNNFGYSGDCITDYMNTSRLTKTAPFVSIASLQDNTAHTAGAISISGTVGAGINAAIYATGNVTITDNITYFGSGGYKSVKDMPYLLIVTDGDVTINSNVTQVDAVIVSKGKVITCEKPISQARDGCKAQNLTYNGAIIAKQVRPFRTAGTLAKGLVNEQPGVANLADSFQMLPEVLMASPPLQRSTGGLKYDSNTELPPLF